MAPSCLWSTLAILVIVNCVPASAVVRRNKELVVEKAKTCITNKTESFMLKFTAPLNFTSINNIVRFYGNFTITEEIRSPLEVTLIAYRCTTNLQNCQKYNALQITKICSFLADTNSFWSPFVQSVQPRLRCPIQPNTYFFKDSTFDLSFFTSFPLEGYTWQTTMKLLSTGYTPKREVFCFACQATLIRGRRN
ncbi:uncharacterized protein LOC131207804 [Anopheles bellator]|uniref:uncharacterized protein LOC131207804 n=1 Tax=Anopheles bellator TaxID=139047 RepID=UPI002648B0BF|nr:uncharacterized protein LOC131207804 [Anopheles bellator]